MKTLPDEKRCGSDEIMVNCDLGVAGCNSNCIK